MILEKKISVITATFNAENSITITLESILNQTYPAYEVIVVDGKSTDNTVSIVNRFKNNTNVIKIISEPDKGVYDAMNKGIDIASGDYIFFLNAGDVLYDNNVFWKLAAFLDKKSVIYGNSFTYNKKRDIVPYRKGSFSARRLATTNICHQTILYPINVLRNNKFNLKYNVFADYDINIRLWKKIKFTYVDIDIVKYEGGGISASTKDKVFEKEYKMKIIKYLGLDAFLYLVYNRFFK